ncbi:MAG: NAD-dependent epimerase/dehydratase family protein [Sphingobacteriia bacterium]|nr:MAG: NAD-dependent epimerase/dehydratase family protein [Sphingobacteriia bacterium]
MQQNLLLGRNYHSSHQTTPWLYGLPNRFGGQWGLQNLSILILVTGGTGLLGSALLQTLVKANEPVRALYRTQKPTWAGSEKIDWWPADLDDVHALEDALSGVDKVYHCAATVSFHPARKKALFQTNVMGTANLVNACLSQNVRRFLLVSSVAALGRIRQEKTIDESMHWSPETSNSEYGRTKYLAELEAWRGMAEGLEVVAVNPVIILGAGNWEGGSSGIFKSAYKEFPWYTEGMSGFVDVQDVVNAMLLVMADGATGERYILSGQR